MTCRPERDRSAWHPEYHAGRLVLGDCGGSGVTHRLQAAGAIAAHAAEQDPHAFHAVFPGNRCKQRIDAGAVRAGCVSGLQDKARACAHGQVHTIRSKINAARLSDPLVFGDLNGELAFMLQPIDQAREEAGADVLHANDRHGERRGQLREYFRKNLRAAGGCADGHERGAAQIGR